jgi:SAM-dependent methyltransferase
MVQNRRSHFYEGFIYHLLVDPALRRVRQFVRSRISRGSSVIDIGCGTGELLFSLADWCSYLVGVETSSRMWSFASRKARARSLKNLRFVLGDGARLASMSNASFDYATACMVLHEMNADQRVPVLQEMHRVATTLILVDYKLPQPNNLVSTFCRFIELMAGSSHYRNFKSFQEKGGLDVLLTGAELNVEADISFLKGCLHLVQAGHTPQKRRRE